MIKHLSVTLFMAIAALACSPQAQHNDFDTVCSYFTQMDKLSNVDTMSNTERNNYILDAINTGLPEDSGARAAWQAIDSAAPDQRYELFISAAESVLNEPWLCPAMGQWASTTGEI